MYREVSIDDDELLAFSRMLGTLVVQSTGEHQYPEIQTITLDPTKTNALLASYRQGNFCGTSTAPPTRFPRRARC